MVKKKKQPIRAKPGTPGSALIRQKEHQKKVETRGKQRFFGRGGETTREGLAQEKKEFGTITGAKKDIEAGIGVKEKKIEIERPPITEKELPTQAEAEQEALELTGGVNVGLQERAEGRVPFGELPEYQQALAGVAVGGVSPKLITSLPSNIVSGLKGAGKLALSSTSKTIITGITGGSGMMTWLASDNIISGMNIFTRDLREAVTFGTTTPAQAMGEMDEAQETVDKAREFINTNTALNPLLWAFRGIILANADAAQRVLDFNRETIIGTQTQEVQGGEE